MAVLGWVAFARLSFRFDAVFDSMSEMKPSALALALSMFGASPALSQTIDERKIAFGCDDIVAIGRVKNGDWHRVDQADDLIGHGWVDATLRVRRVLKGSVNGRTVPVRYLAHTFMRDDRDFMFVISRQPDGSLIIETGQLMSARPKLAAHCG